MNQTVAQPVPHCELGTSRRSFFESSGGQSFPPCPALALSESDMVSFAVQQDLSRSSALLPNLAVTSAVPGRTVSGGQTPALAQLTTAGCVGEYDDTPVPLLLVRV